MGTICAPIVAELFLFCYERGDLAYKFKRIVGKPNFSVQFKNIIKRYKRVG